MSELYHSHLKIMFLYPEIIFHTGTVNISFVQEKSISGYLSLVNYRVFDFRVCGKERFLLYMKDLYVSSFGTASSSENVF